MRRASRRLAACGLGTALCVTLMALGSALGVMTYASPLLAGLVVGLIRGRYGARDALTMWAAASLLGLLLVPEVEMSGLFAGLFGWYPAVKPALDRLPRWRRRLGKCGAFLGAALVVYGALGLLLSLEALGLAGPGQMGLLLAAVGLIFALYDRALARAVPALLARLGRLMP